MAKQLTQEVTEEKKGVEEAAISAAEPVQNALPEDEFAGQGGSYLIDPATGKRVKNLGDTQNG